MCVYHTSQLKSKDDLLEMESFIPTYEEEYGLPRMLHVHNDKLEIVYVREGVALYNIGGNVYDIKSGDLLVLHPGVIHGREPARGTMQSNYCCAIRNLHLDGLPENHLLDENIKPVLHCEEHAERVRSVMQLLLNETENPSGYSPQNINHLLHVLINLVCQIAQQQETIEKDPDLVMVARVKNYIEQHYMHNPSLSDIANSLNISLFYMAHYFKEKTGYTPIQYVTARQIGEAQTLLIHTEMTVQEISEQVGYMNPEHFNKVFKKYIGLPPGKFRKINRSIKTP